MSTAGIGGPITGKGCHVLLVDDPHKNLEEASSDIFQERAWDWFKSTALTRLEPDGGAVLVMTRWHEFDLAGRILDRVEEMGTEPWEIIRIPAIAESEDPLSRKIGEPLWPSRYNLKQLESIENEVGDYVWQALYQQTPPSKIGNPVYSFTKANLVPDLKLMPHLPLAISIDFNRVPGMHALLGQYDPAQDVVMATHEIHGPRMTIRQMIAELRRMIDSELGGWQWPDIEVFGDASGWQANDRDDKSKWDWVREELKVHEIPHTMRVPRNNPGRVDRVNRMNYAMQAADGKVRLKVHPRCKILQTDFKRMRWDGNDFSQKDKKLGHISDCCGYLVNMLLPIRKALKYRGCVVMMGGTNTRPW